MGKYLNTKQAAEYLGTTPQAIRLMVFRKQIPYRKPNGRLLFLCEEIDRWVDLSKGLTLEEYSGRID